MSIPISIFLILFLVVVLFFLIFSFFNIFHTLRYGLAAPANSVALTFYIIGSLALLIISAIVIFSVDWSLTISILGGGSPIL